VNEDLAALARIGGIGSGVRRLAWSDEHRASLDWLATRLEESGFSPQLDAAGNMIGRWSVGEGTAIVMGSHIDSGPNAGRYDGTLGVLGAIAAVDHLRARGAQPKRPIWIASFMDEEGVRFGTSMIGSRAFVGDDVSDALPRADADGMTIESEVRRWGLDPARMAEARAIDEVGAYVELHIEQGPLLEQSGTEIGVVTGIVGLVQARVRLEGEANHAGTTPMDLRHDALMGMTRIGLALRNEAIARGGTVTIGSVDVQPGAFTVIPSECRFSIDFRVGSEEEFGRLEELIGATVRTLAAEEGLAAEVEFTDVDPPVELDEGIVGELARSAEREGASYRLMPSGAGHDAMLIAPHVPTGMLFVPSEGGISHSPEEFTAPEHCELGVRVLARTLETLAC
jgi:hydantoinase/carbamoylase family amidase